jgi:hypothetical protein
VVSVFDEIVPVFDWSSQYSEDWRKLDIHKPYHDVIWFSLGQGILQINFTYNLGKRYLVDLCGPCYGISTYNEDNKPLWISHYDEQKHYVTEKLAFPDEIDKMINDKIQEAKVQNEKTGMIDWKPLMALNAKQSIVKACLNL